MKNFDKLSKEEVIDELKKYIEAQMALIDRKELSSEAFTSCAWPFKQANFLGQKKVYNKLLKLLQR